MGLVVTNFTSRGRSPAEAACVPSKATCGDILLENKNDLETVWPILEM